MTRDAAALTALAGAARSRSRRSLRIGSAGRQRAVRAARTAAACDRGDRARRPPRTERGARGGPPGPVVLLENPRDLGNIGRVRAGRRRCRRGGGAHNGQPRPLAPRRAARRGRPALRDAGRAAGHARARSTGAARPLLALDPDGEALDPRAARSAERDAPRLRHRARRAQPIELGALAPYGASLRHPDARRRGGLEPEPRPTVRRRTAARCRRPRRVCRRPRWRRRVRPRSRREALGGAVPRSGRICGPGAIRRPARVGSHSALARSSAAWRQTAAWAARRARRSPERRRERRAYCRSAQSPLLASAPAPVEGQHVGGARRVEPCKDVSRSPAV